MGEQQNGGLLLMPELSASHPWQRWCFAASLICGWEPSRFAMPAARCWQKGLLHTSLLQLGAESPQGQSWLECQTSGNRCGC